MASEMVKRLAFSAFRTWHKSGIAQASWDGLPESAREAWYVTARAMMNEFREPTDHMINKAIFVCDVDDSATNIRRLCREVWLEMIDEAMRDA